MYDDVLLGMKTDEEQEQEIMSEQEREQEMEKDTEIQLIKKYINNGWPIEHIMRGEEAHMHLTRNDEKAEDEIMTYGFVLNTFIDDNNTSLSEEADNKM
ncbi:hypothetical protein NDU88_003293 [Pleurodeles waltl]|uniref:Uncharacterized protein n=1 Tax=Pleurodeles waltl TaxID=8319 RepID=A0AAV7W1Q5_PLEWA|nr:hypothetical protein NDU88_003293 [Pleurodeles waltl]